MFSNFGIGMFVVLFASQLFAQSTLPRSVNERLAGENAFISDSKVMLENALEGIEPNQTVSELSFLAPTRRSSNGNIIPFGNRLNLEKKRSAVLINSQNKDDIMNDRLVDSIERVVNSPALLKQLGVDTKKSGVDGFHIIGNFRSTRKEGGEPEWFVALIPKDVVVEKVILQTEHFGGGAGAHNQIRFILSQPVLGIVQIDDTYTPITFHREAYQGKGDIVFTLQAARTEAGEQMWDPLRGLMSEYGNALQFFDTQTLALDQVQRSVIDDLLLLDAEDGSSFARRGMAIFEKAIALADENQETTIYNTVFASCVTYALKALKAGIPDIDTTWFNPYTVDAYVTEALGRSTNLNRSSMNDLYQGVLEAAGIEVMTRAKLEATELFQATNNKVIRSILVSPAFEKIVQRVAYFINKNNIQYQQVDAFLEAASRPGAKIAEIKKSGEAQVLFDSIYELWRSEFDGEPIEYFFQALKGLQTQEAS